MGAGWRGTEILAREVTSDRVEVMAAVALSGQAGSHPVELVRVAGLELVADWPLAEASAPVAMGTRAVIWAAVVVRPEAVRELAVTLGRAEILVQAARSGRAGIAALVKTASVPLLHWADSRTM